MLTVEAPATWQPEREYAVDVVLGGMLGLPHRVRFGDRQGWRLVLEGAEGEVVLPDTLLASPDDAWLSPSSIPAGPLGTGPGGLPVFFGETREHAPEPDPFATAFFFLTRYEERARRAVDAHGRFPSAEAVAVRAGLVGRPVVDETVEWLWGRLHAAWPGLVREEHRFVVSLTHDVDWVSTVTQPFPRLARLVAGDAVRRRDLGLAWRRAAAASRARLGRGDAGDPADTFDFLMSTSERAGLRSAFYLIATPPGARGFHNEAYDLRAPRVQALIGSIHERGHELGLHGAYGTQTSPASLSAQLTALRSAAAAAGVEQETWGGRQHFLQFTAPATWAAWEATGLAHDSSVAFADAPGFRCGTTRPFRVFDLDARRALALVERPLVAMDGSFLDRQYLGLGPEEASSRILELARTCKRHGGRFTLLWHNTALVRRSDRALYAELVAALGGL